MNEVKARRGGNVRNGKCTFPNVRRRQEAAAARALEASQRTPEQQLARLDQAFGQGQGAAKERAKLALRIKLRDEKPQGVKPAAEQPQVAAAPKADNKKQRRKNRRNAATESGQGSPQPEGQ